MIFYFFLKYKKYFVKAIIYQKTELNSIQCIEREVDKPFFVWSTGLYIFPAKTLIYQHLLLFGEERKNTWIPILNFQWIPFTFSKSFQYQQVLFSYFYQPENMRAQEPGKQNTQPWLLFISRYYQWHHYHILYKTLKSKWKLFQKFFKKLCKNYVNFSARVTLEK